MGTTQDDSVKQKIRSKIMETFAYIQVTISVNSKFLFDILKKYKASTNKFFCYKLI